MTRDLPSGTVTFLFTDIEGSTALLRELGDGYAAALAAHRQVVRDAFKRHGGVEVDTQGDAIFVAFARATDALAAAAAAQAALRDGPIRVRMGIHTGEPLLTSEGYVGIDVHRAARIAAAGHGGQVLVSRSTADLAAGEGLRDLGQHRLKDLTASERIFQVGDEPFPPLRSLDRTNLPITATPLIGRERELLEIITLIRDGRRLVTLTGAGGSGKTRLALQVAAELAGEFADGVFFVPLAPVHDPALVASTITQAVGIRDLNDIREAEILLVVDNVEHLLPAATELATMLAAAARVRLVVTSRVRLRISAEVEYPLDPLIHAEAVAFFVERARALSRDVRGDPAVDEICRRLDGLPLALELAASRLKVLDPALLLDRLGQRLSVLQGGARDVPERQQTLRATIDWSHSLLEARSQQAFRRLAVFASSFSLEAAASIAELDLDDIAALVDWSLLKSVGEGRFLMLETIREYAGERLAESAEWTETCDRHVAYYLDLVETAEPNLTGSEQRIWFGRLTADQDDLRAALGYACDAGDGERALMLIGTSWRYWWTRAPVAEAAYWYERAFAIGDGASLLARARATFGAAHLAESTMDAEQARRRFAEAAELLEEAGETRWLVLALTHLAGAHHELGDAQRATDLNERAVEIAEGIGYVRGVVVVRSNRAASLAADGEYPEATADFEAALAASRTIGDIQLIASVQISLAKLSLRASNPDIAATRLHESLLLLRSIGDALDQVSALQVAAATVLALGGAGASARLCAAVDVISRELGYEYDRASMDETKAAAGVALGDAFEPAWQAGTALDLDAAVTLALDSLSEGRPDT